MDGQDGGRSTDPPPPDEHGSGQELRTQDEDDMHGHAENASGVVGTVNSGAGRPSIVYNTDDPEPHSPDATREKKNAYSVSLQKYSDEMLKAIEESGISGRTLWEDMTTVFGKDTIACLPTNCLLSWRILLLRRGVKVRKGETYIARKHFGNAFQQKSFRA